MNSLSVSEKINAINERIAVVKKYDGIKLLEVYRHFPYQEFYAH